MNNELIIFGKVKDVLKLISEYKKKYGNIGLNDFILKLKIENET